ncbi:MAG: hypothetical protein RIR97_595 [Pseudomonadota bacterium]
MTVDPTNPYLPGFPGFINGGEDGFGLIGQYKIVGISDGAYALDIDGSIEIISMKVHKPTCRYLGSGVYCDKKKIYQSSYEILRPFVSDIDLPTVRLVASHGSSLYLADQKGVFCDSFFGAGWIDGADPQSFQVIDIEKFFTADRNHFYYHHSIMPGTPDDCVFLNDTYLIHDHKVYFGYTSLIKDVDIKSFEILENNRRLRNVARDKKHVYFRDQPVADIDPATFTILPGCVDPSRDDEVHWNEGTHDFVRDARHLWFVNTHAPESETAFRMLKVSHPSEFDFRVVNAKGYATDGATWFYKTRKVKPPSEDNETVSD